MNEGYDRSALRDQALKRDVDRGLKAPVGEPGFTLPAAQARAEKALFFAEDGTPDTISVNDFAAPASEAAARSEAYAGVLGSVNTGYWEPAINPPPADAADGQTYFVATADGREILARNEAGVGVVVFERATTKAVDTLTGRVEIIRERIPTFEDMGARGNGLDSDDPFILAALETYPVVTGTPGRVYRLTGNSPMLMERFKRIVGVGGPAEAVTNDSGQSGFKLWFDGSGPACIANANPGVLLSHCGFKDFNIHVTGNYGWVFDIRSAVEVLFDTMQIEVASLSTGIIRSQKVTPADPSWINRLTNCQLRLPDASTAYVMDHDWSDSPILGTHFTGGRGVIDRDYGARYTGCQFERSTRAGLTVQKRTDTKGGSAVGCAFDANAVCGVEYTVDGDATTSRYIGFQLVANTFRTVSEAAGSEGVPGTAHVIYTNNTGNTYSALAQRDSAYLYPVINGQQLNGSWGLSSGFFGDLTLGVNGATVVDQNGIIHVGGTDVVLRAGNGSPEGMADGAIGSLYMRRDGTAGSRLYIKTTTAGVLTGWSATA